MLDSDDTTRAVRGRPPAGRGENGKPEKVSDYPKLTISITPESKARLEAYSTLTRRPAWRIIDDALKLLLESIPADDKWAVEGMAKRMRAHSAPARRKSVA